MQNLNWEQLEHLVWRQLKKSHLEDQNSFLLAISGGLDSMVLLHVMLKVKSNADFNVVTYHHGDSSDQSTQVFRDSCIELVKHKVSLYNQQRISENKSLIVFKTKKMSQDTNDKFKAEDVFQNKKISEAEYRNARWAFLKEINKIDQPIVTAHHLDDRFETLLLKLIRGASLDGLQAFKVWNQEIFRPFLEVTRQELREYALKHKLSWLDDPSNDEVDFFRNWIRNDWLNQLESRQPGAVKRFSKSLIQVVDQGSLKTEFRLVYWQNNLVNGLDRVWYSTLSEEDKLRSLALFLRKSEILSFTTGQLKEIKKRLDKNQKDITFELIGRKWVINAMQIMIR